MIPQVPNVSQIPLEKNGAFSRPWYSFFRDLIGSFVSADWTPTFAGLLTVGTVGVTATYTRAGQMMHYSIDIVPVGAATIASTFNSTTISNLPATAIKPGSGWSINANLGTLLGPCFVVDSSRTLKLPTWAATNSRILITGSYPIGS